MLARCPLVNLSRAGRLITSRSRPSSERSYSALAYAFRATPNVLLNASSAPAPRPLHPLECGVALLAIGGVRTAKIVTFKTKIPKITYDLNDAIRIMKAYAVANFDETVEVAVNLGIDPRQGNQLVRGFTQLPYSTGKQVRVAVFARGEKAIQAKEAGADVVGAEDLVELVKEGKVDFDRCIATPDVMPLVGTVARVLGPKGLMPNPKMGSVTTNVVDAVRDAKGSKVEFRADKCAIVHAGVAKVSLPPEQIAANIRELIGAISKARPPVIKQDYLRKVSMSSTMGPGIPISLGSIDPVLAKGGKRKALQAPPIQAALVPA